jgi:hypothetical protein
MIALLGVIEQTDNGTLITQLLISIVSITQRFRFILTSEPIPESFVDHLGGVFEQFLVPFTVCPRLPDDPCLVVIALMTLFDFTIPRNISLVCSIVLHRIPLPLISLHPLSLHRIISLVYHLSPFSMDDDTAVFLFSLVSTYLIPDVEEFRIWTIHNLIQHHGSVFAISPDFAPSLCTLYRSSSDQIDRGILLVLGGFFGLKIPIENCDPSIFVDGLQHEDDRVKAASCFAIMNFVHCCDGGFPADVCEDIFMQFMAILVEDESFRLKEAIAAEFRVFMLHEISDNRYESLVDDGVLTAVAAMAEFPMAEIEVPEMLSVILDVAVRFGWTEKFLAEFQRLALSDILDEMHSEAAARFRALFIESFPDP